MNIETAAAAVIVLATASAIGLAVTGLLALRRLRRRQEGWAKAAAAEVRGLTRRYFFRSLLVLDVLWVLVWIVGLTFDTPTFDVIALVVGSVGVLVALFYTLVSGRSPEDVLSKVIEAVDTHRILQGVLLLIVPITIIGWSVWEDQFGADSYDWCDRFDGTRINEDRWRVESDPNLIDVRDGVLNFVSTPEQSKGEMGGSLLARVPEDRDIAEVSFIMTLKSLESWEGTGGAGVGFNLANGRDVAFKVGPNPDGEPEGEFWACETFLCGSIGSGDYEDYVTDTSTFRKDDEAIPIQVAQTDEGIEFYIDGEPRDFRIDGKRFEETTPIVGFGFAMYADEGAQFHLTIDDVCVDYVDS